MIGVYRVLLIVKCSSSVCGRSVHFRFLTTFVSQKRLVAERNGPKFVPEVYMHVFSVYRVILTVKCSSSVWGHSVHLSYSATLYLENHWS